MYFVAALGCCICGVDVSRAGIGDAVVLIDAGLIDLLMLQLIKLVGPSQIVLLDLKNERLQLAAKFGANVAINRSKERLNEASLAFKHWRHALSVFLGAISGENAISALIIVLGHKPSEKNKNSIVLYRLRKPFLNQSQG